MHTSRLSGTHDPLYEAIQRGRDTRRRVRCTINQDSFGNRIYYFSSNASSPGERPAAYLSSCVALPNPIWRAFRRIRSLSFPPLVRLPRTFIYEFSKANIDETELEELPRSRVPPQRSISSTCGGIYSSSQRGKVFNESCSTTVSSTASDTPLRGASPWRVSLITLMKRTTAPRWR